MKAPKNYRILRLYMWLDEGRCVNIFQVSNEFQVDVRTLQRDIADLRAFLAEDMMESGNSRKIIYDRVRNGYCIIQ